MAERKTPIFVVTTTNAIDHLPPELIRKEHFDELFFVDLPDTEMRANIFRIHLQHHELKPTNFDLTQLTATSKDFSNTEIEQTVVSALYTKQAQQQTIDQTLLLRALQSTAPLSIMMAKRLTALRQWANKRTINTN